MLRSAAALLLALTLAGCRNQPELPKLFPVPSATLVDERGRSVALDSMKGGVTVYDFIFTNCTGTCPMMTSNMRRLTAKIPKDAQVRFVSISVDPERDTPRQLADYALRFRNDPRWTFLTGDRATIVKVSVEGFKLTAGDPAPGGEPLLHSSKFAVAVGDGVIREYYGGTDGDMADHVAKTVSQLLAE